MAGGILNNGDLTLLHCVVRGNESVENGGGVRAQSTGVVAGTALLNCLFVGNVAGGYGGAAYSSAPIRIAGSTIVGNTAVRGGGLDFTGVEGAGGTMGNTIVAENRAINGPNLKLYPGALSGSYNLIDNGLGQTDFVHGTDGNLVGTTEMPIDPLFLRNPSPGQDGLWGTLDDDFGDLSLRGDSPAVDAGGASLLPSDLYDADDDGDVDEPIPFDLTGNARTYNEVLDMGAYETHPGVLVSGSLANEPNSGQVALTFTVSIYPAQPADFTAEYSTSDLSAAAGTDYTAVSGTLTIPAGEIVATIDVPVLGDWDAEGDEAFLLHLTGEFEGNPFEHEATGTILDNDGRDYLVDSLDDTITEDGVLTLREALEAANTNTAVGDAPAGYAGPQTDYIRFAPALFADGPATIYMNGTAFTIADDTLVLGPGADLLTLDAQDQSRVFEIGPSASATIVGLNVTHGYTADSGGGIFSEGILKLVNCRIIANESEQNGGGVLSHFADGTAELVLLSCELTHNRAADFGGAISNGAPLSITNCTITANAAGREGGGVHSGVSAVTMNNSIIAGNVAKYESSAADVYHYSGTLQGADNIIGVDMGQEVFINGTDGNLVGTYESPFDPRFLQDPDPGPDGEWGTADDIAGDLRLQVDSPAIDGGDATRLPTDIYDLDADGDVSETLPSDLIGGDRIAGGAVDLGAFETQPGWQIAPARVTEGDDGTSVMRFTVSLYPAPEVNVTVDFTTEDGTATAGGDYEFASGTLTIPAGEVFASIEVPILGDRDQESNETFLLTLNNSSGPAIAIPEAVCTIVDNDGQTYVVDSLEDVVAADGLLTLREALQAANSNLAVGDAPAGIPGPRMDHIMFDPVLFADGPVSIALSDGSLSVADAVAIVGPGADLLAVDGAGQSGVFVVEQDITAKIAGITITGGNVAEDMGGGILNKGNLTVADAVIRDNTAKYGGGVMNYGYNAHAALTLSDCIILRNASTKSGGGVYSYGGGYSKTGSASIEMTSCQILGNTAEIAGGIYVDGWYGPSSLDLLNSLIVGNTATNLSGAVYCSSRDGTTTITVANSTIAANSADVRGGAIVNYGVFDGTIVVEATNSVISLNDAPTAPNLTETLDGNSRANLIGIDPLFVRNPSPGEDGIWGTEDDDYGDLTPSPESPAIDAGLGDVLSDTITTDILGNPRTFGQRIDVGAVESQAAPAPGRETPSAVVTTETDVVDQFDGLISLREALFYVETAQTASESITFAPALDGATIALSGSPLEVGSSVAIDASALESLTIDAGRQSRVFIVRGENEVVFDSLTITGGFDDNKGGGIYNSATLAVLNSTLVRNEADYYGGGICNTGVLNLVNSSILGNTTGSCGGGLFNEGTADFTNVVIAGNRASGGAGIENRGSLVLSNVSIAGNTGSSYGGGIENSSLSHDDPPGTIVLNNTIIAGNTAETSPDIHYYGEAATGSYNLIGTRSISGGTGNLSGTEESPLDACFLRNPGPGPDGEWGTWDDDYGNLALRSDSPALGAGDTGLIPLDTFDLDGDSYTDEPVPYDANGNPRLTDGTVSMGALESIPGIFVSDAAQLEGNEGMATLRFVVSIYPAPENDATIDYATSDLTATAGVDYTATAGTLTIPAGASEGGIEVPIETDLDIEEHETFLLTLSNSSGPDIIDTEVIGTIADDDGQTIVVNSLADIVAEDGVITLREALEAANTNTVVADAPAGYASPRMDHIRFSPELFANGGATILLENGELSLSENATIVGPGSDLLIIDANEMGRILSVETDARALLGGLTLTGGQTTERGGAIENSGDLTAVRCAFTENSSDWGGAIYNDGDLLVDGCFFHANLSANSGSHSQLGDLRHCRINVSRKLYRRVEFKGWCHRNLGHAFNCELNVSTQHRRSLGRGCRR